MKLLDSIHRKRTWCITISCFGWRSAISFCFEGVKCITPSSTKEILYGLSEFFWLWSIIHGQKQNPLPNHEVLMVFHHQFWKTILAVRSLKRRRSQGNLNHKDSLAICSSNTIEISETLLTDKGRSSITKWGVEKWWIKSNQNSWCYNNNTCQVHCTIIFPIFTPSLCPNFLQLHSRQWYIDGREVNDRTLRWVVIFLHLVSRWSCSTYTGICPYILINHSLHHLKSAV